MQISIKKQKPFAELLPHPRDQGCALGIVYDGGKLYSALYILLDDDIVEEMGNTLIPLGYKYDLDITPGTILSDYCDAPEDFEPLEN